VTRAAVAAALLLLVAAAPALAKGPTTTQTTTPSLTGFTAPPRGVKPALTKKEALKIFLAVPKVKDWLSRYPKKGRLTEVTFEKTYKVWEVKIWWDKAGEIAQGEVDDLSAKPTAYTGPQVAWTMARGGKGAFGGRQINSYTVWLGFCAAFFIGLADLRRWRSLRNLDLIALLSFSVSLWYFQHGRVFSSASWVYPPLFYLLGRTIWIGVRDRPPRTSRPLWPVWVLAAATVFLGGFKVGLNVWGHSNVIDVGYAGPIGAERITHGQSPYGHFPIESTPSGVTRPKCPGALADRSGEVRERIQTNGRCESANPNGDTYGPMSYITYIPGYLLFGWSGHWDTLPAAHFTSIAFDLLCLIGLALVGWRFGRERLAVTLAFAWAAYPFTQYVSNSNTNDAIMPAFLIWGFWLCTSPWARGLFAGLAGWTKFAALIVAPLWLTYPDRGEIKKNGLRYLGGFAIATALSFWVLLLEPNPLHAARTFWDRTIPTQIDRHSPFSLWDWAQYHAAGVPNLHIVQQILQVALVAGAIAAALFPRRKSPLQLAALTGALLIGFEVVLTHWFYLYLPWFFAFVAYAVLAAEPQPQEAAVVESADERPSRELVPTA
jgi:hypothetical protein